MLQDYGRGGGLLDALCAHEHSSTGHRDPLNEQSIFAAGVDKAYGAAMQPVAGEDRDGATFRGAEQEATRLAMGMLSETMVQDYAYPESFHIGARFWEQHVPRYLYSYESGMHCAKASNVRHQEESTPEWALLLVHLGAELGDHYDLIKLAC